MSTVKSKDSKIEILFRKELWKRGIRYRKNKKGYFGKPDLINKAKNTAIFIDSCFWHGCKKHCRMPSTNKKYWENKIKRNKERDRLVLKFYTQKGWTTIRIWEHTISDKKSFQRVVQGIIKKLK